MCGKLRIRVFSWVFQLFLIHTTKGAFIQLYLGIGVERVMSLSVWLLLGKKGQGEFPMSYPMVRRKLTRLNSWVKVLSF
jgi:hypothetical protein